MLSLARVGVTVGVPCGYQRAPSKLTDFWGEFQGKEASEQRIRELCGGMVSGECPRPTWGAPDPPPWLARRPGLGGLAPALGEAAPAGSHTGLAHGPCSKCPLKGTVTGRVDIRPPRFTGFLRRCGPVWLTGLPTRGTARQTARRSAVRPPRGNDRPRLCSQKSKSRS